MKTLRLMLAAGALLSTACGGMKAAKTNTTEFGDDKPKVESLAGKSTPEVLKLKYKRAEVVCRAFSGLTSVNVKEFSQVSSPAELRVNLLEQKNLEKIGAMEFPLAREGSQGQVRVEIGGLTIQNQLTHIDKSGNVYEMQYTPRVTVKYNFDNNVTGGLITFETGGWELSENTPMMDFFAYGGSEKLLASGQHQAHGLGCLIETELKAEYQNQFKLTKKK